ncbi:MAG: Quinolinate synthase A [Bacteroidetes bacterium ADurb.Bin408]|nr:MAG: Quinolinate synthase A [Bacteroidetes bacterium ADurb.Bin408]
MGKKLIRKNKADIFYLEEINRLRKFKNAVILAHFYQQPEIQDVADFIGDSLALSQQAAETDADIIVFCGVKFMAETAKILSPQKKVLLPDMEAGCSLADSCTYEDLAALKKKYPGHKVITYINSTARVKTISDVVCTSSNAVNVVNSFPEGEKLIFTPDKNLGNWVKEKTGKDMVIWQGSCEVHDVLKIENIIKLKELYPDARIIAHPECKDIILKIADFVGSTTALLDYTVKSKSTRFIVATESGVLHQMKKKSPDKEFIVVPADETCSCNNCAFMKMITLEKLYMCLKNEKPEIKLTKNLIEKAKEPLMKMLTIK